MRLNHLLMRIRQSAAAIRPLSSSLNLPRQETNSKAVGTPGFDTPRPQPMRQTVLTPITLTGPRTIAVTPISLPAPRKP